VLEPEEDVDALAKYDAIVQEVLAGRTEGHKCPGCGDGELECRLDESGRLTIKCLKCGRFFEGMLA
jgi:hypothetical protein